MWRDPDARVGQAYGYERGKNWNRARRLHLREQPSCVACKKQYRGFLGWFVRLWTGTVVHQIIPLHICFALDRPDLETDSRNLVTLCAGHHFLIGHLGHFRCFNLYVKATVIRCFGRTPQEFLESPDFEYFASKGYKPFDEWTGEEMAEFRQKLDEKFPPK